MPPFRGIAMLFLQLFWRLRRKYLIPSSLQFKTNPHLNPSFTNPCALRNPLVTINRPPRGILSPRQPLGGAVASFTIPPPAGTIPSPAEKLSCRRPVNSKSKVIKSWVINPQNRTRRRRPRNRPSPTAPIKSENRKSPPNKPPSKSVRLPPFSPIWGRGCPADANLANPSFRP